MSEIESIRQYECDSCRKRFTWNTRSRTRTIYHKRWDEVITVCSEKCMKAFDKKGKK